MLKQNPSFVVIGTKVKRQAVKTILPSEIIHFLGWGCFCRKSWKNDAFRALSTRLDKCNDIQMSRIILCLWGAWSNWILIKYWAKETLYLIMQAVPLDFLSGELQSAQQNGLYELVAASRKGKTILQSDTANTCANNTGNIIEFPKKVNSWAISTNKYSDVLKVTLTVFFKVH